MKLERLNPLNWYHRTQVALLAFLMMPAAHAQETDLAGVSDHVGDQVKTLWSLIQIAAAVTGAGLVAWGILKIVFRRQGQDTIGGAITMIVIGSLGVVVSVVIEIMTQTTVGSDAEGIDLLNR